MAELPAPRAAAGQLLIHTTHTLVSAGTERMLVEFGKANWLDKARQQPDKVRMVLDKVRTDGLAAYARGGAASSISRCRWAIAMSAGHWSR